MLVYMDMYKLIYCQILGRHVTRGTFVVNFLEIFDGVGRGRIDAS